jgi:SNF2 family DNA or RNA helicase
MAFIFVDSDNFLAIQDGYSERKVIGDIGGQFDPVTKLWKVAFTSFNLDYLLDNIKEPRVAEDIDVHVQKLQEREIALSQIRAMSKSDAPVRIKVPGLKLPLYNYQKLGVMFAITNGFGTLIADEMGLGKSLQSIATAVYLKDKGLAKNALIVTPASLKFNWPLEIEKFTDEKYVVIDGTPEERIVQWLKEDVFFFVVNYELLLEDLFGGRKFKEKEGETFEAKQRREMLMAKAKQRERILEPIRTRVWDFIAADEIHFAKSYTSSRSRCLKLMRAKFRMGLTGTPMDGRLEELHSIMGFVAPGLLGSKTRFFQRHIETDFYGKVTGYKRLGEVTKRIESFFIRRLKKEVLKDLPDKVYENRMVVLSPDEMKIYRKLAEGGHEATQDEEAIVAVIRCKQFCNWPKMVDESCEKSSKMDSFKEVVDEVVLQNTHKALVFSQYKQMLNIIVKVLDEMGVKYLRIDGDTPSRQRANMQKEFNTDAKIDMMVGTDAMSLGLNFTSADVVIMYEDSWSPSVMNQREDRAHRLGQKNVVTVVNFICKNTIEERIRGVIYGKNRITAQVLGDETDEMTLRRLNPKEIAKLL